jgi:allantoinase
VTQLPDLLIVRSRRVLTESGIREASVHITNGRIAAISAWDDVPPRASLEDAGYSVVMPGVIDTHVHINEPGRTAWEGFATATRAAAAGGVTTLLDMPLNSIPATTTVDALHTKREAARGKAVVNVEYIGGVVPGNADQIEPLAAAGVRAFKCFLTPSGVDEFPNVGEDDLRTAFPMLARTGLPLMVHAEDPALIGAPPSGGARAYATYLASRPPEAERSAIELLVRLMEKCPTRVHIVHLSSARSLDVVSRARSRGLPITVETCPHYLTFAAEEIPDGAVEYKCAPPIRSTEEREALWRALIAGEIDSIASDHSPCPPTMKETGGEFFSAWGGVASLQLQLSAVWTGARERGVPMSSVSRWMSANPATLAGVADRRGRLAPGKDADIVIWDPEAHFTVDPSVLEHRHHITPYAGRTLFGRIVGTLVSGTWRWMPNAARQ